MIDEKKWRLLYFQLDGPSSVWPDAWFKVAQMFSKVVLIISKPVFTLIDHFKIAQKSTIFLGYFWEWICCQELSKIAQSGHTDHPPLSYEGNLFQINYRRQIDWLFWVAQIKVRAFDWLKSRHWWKLDRRRLSTQPIDQANFSPSFEPFCGEIGPQQLLFSVVWR